MYAISAQIEIAYADGSTTSRGVPTFYLNANVQGIMSEDGAREIATDILRTLPVDPSVTVVYHVTAVKV